MSNPIDEIKDPLAKAFAVFNGADDPVLKHTRRFKEWEPSKQLKTRYEVIEAEELQHEEK
tara:strand:- start:167 stop:346 length:180 start_codon:yes stop_codon:yes gene_type:complete